MDDKIRLCLPDSPPCCPDWKPLLARLKRRDQQYFDIVTNMSGNAQRPLSELSPMAQRRNSPSWKQTTKLTLGSSPFDSSPFNASTSRHLFWQDRESASSFQSLNSENARPYDPEVPYSPTKRASIENLKRASRVKNSSLIAREQNTEYDPSHVTLPERPLASGRSFHGRSQSDIPSPLSPSHQDNHHGSSNGDVSPRHRPVSPSKDQPSPPKSSLSKATRFGYKLFDPENDIWSDIEGGPSRFSDRNPKSVTFDAAPPQVNEYEMTTPDISSLVSESREGSYEFDEDEIDASFDRGSSLDRDDSFDASLEDIEKTPVVLPEDWRFMSPDSANDELVSGDEDPFTDHGSPSPDAQPVPNSEGGHRDSRIDSLGSDGDKRPLPPLPYAKYEEKSPRLSSPSKLSAAFELASGGQRVLPSPPRPATYSKTDIVGSTRPSMTLEDRVRLMMLQEKGSDTQQAEAERQKQKERRMRRAGSRERSTGFDYEDREPSESAASQVNTPPHISREDILRNIKSRQDMSYDDDSDYPSQLDSSPPPHTTYDPDVPIPSLENHLDEFAVQIKEEPEDYDDDLYDVPEYYGPNAHGLPLHEDEHQQDDDDQSTYSRDSGGSVIKQEREISAESMESDSTTVPIHEFENANRTTEHIQPTNSEPSNKFQELDFGLDNLPEPLQRPQTPVDQTTREVANEPSTPDSVIRHPVDDEYDDEQESTPEPVSDLVATIKAPGTGLKTRPSLTPADVQSMAAVRRNVSLQSVNIPSLETTEETQQEENDPEQDTVNFQKPDSSIPTLSLPEVAQRQSSLVKLDIPFTGSGESLEFGLDKEFDRVIEAQKRGYLMRQNTKVIIASSNNDESQPPTQDPSTNNAEVKPANSSPRKASQPTWTAEPWNGKMRRQSIKAAGVVKKKPVPGAVPPLPGMSSNVQDIQHGIEEIESPTMAEFPDDGQERGRLFVKVVGVRDLDMPLPKEKLHFALTLDNGLHCVTTSWLELGRSAPIGQEFELIVHKDLEFQLTLQMKTEGTYLKQSRESVSSSSPSKQKSSAFSRVFASPKKRKEMEMKQMEQQQKQRMEAKAISGPWEKLRTLIDRDGNFARAYVALSDHEKHAFGRPYTVRIPCFNEWAIEEPSSLKSKKGSSTNIVQKRPPYKVGNLEIQLLYVPKPKGAKEEDMPKSMNACIREMREAENTASRMWEGFLSQQGGDCPYWRRRFFRLQGPKLTAYHEVTRQPRATINLAKAAKLIDDKSSLTQKETTTKGGGRRKSAFSEEEEGYMFVEEGFRIRFANGEVIDFYADSRAEKEGWMKVLSETVGKGYSAGTGQVKAWTELVFKHEKNAHAKREALDRLMTANGPPSSSQKELPSPAKSAAQAPLQPARPRLF